MKDIKSMEPKHKIGKLPKSSSTRVEDKISSKKNTTNKVAVLMPVYNDERHIITALKSIQNQTFLDTNIIEIIIYNDGSTDQTVKKIEDFQKINSRENLQITILNPEEKDNKGIAYARNQLTKHIKENVKIYSYVANLDSDDEMSPNFIEKFEFQMKKTKANICLFEAQLKFEVGKKRLELIDIEKEISSKNKTIEEKKQMKTLITNAEGAKKDLENTKKIISDGIKNGIIPSEVAILTTTLGWMKGYEANFFAKNMPPLLEKRKYEDFALHVMFIKDGAKITSTTECKGEPHINFLRRGGSATGRRTPKDFDDVICNLAQVKNLLEPEEIKSFKDSIEKFLLSRASQYFNLLKGYEFNNDDLKGQNKKDVIRKYIKDAQTKLGLTLVEKKTKNKTYTNTIF